MCLTVVLNSTITVIIPLNKPRFGCSNYLLKYQRKLHQLFSNDCNCLLFLFALRRISLLFWAAISG